MKRKSVVPRLLGLLERRKRKKRKKRLRQNLRPSGKKRKRRYVFLSDFFVSFRLTNKTLLSLLVLRLRNKKLRLLMQQRRLEGSNAQKELRWFWIPISQTFII